MCRHGDAGTTTLVEHAHEWHRLGARLIGGCRRTTPACIGALRARAAQPKAA
jgi:S-methylmethionine-dependent homocysteine/selenocysteine methylase